MPTVYNGPTLPAVVDGLHKLLWVSGRTARDRSGGRSPRPYVPL